MDMFTLTAVLPYGEASESDKLGVERSNAESTLEDEMDGEAERNE